MPSNGASKQKDLKAFCFIGCHVFLGIQEHLPQVEESSAPQFCPTRSHNPRLHEKIPPLLLEALSLIPPLLPRSCIFQYNVFSGNKLYKTLSISAASFLFNIRAFLFPPFLLNSCHCLLTHQNLAVREERDATALCIS